MIVFVATLHSESDSGDMLWVLWHCCFYSCCFFWGL